ncbi:hypothetical protein V5E97_25070 [Singulisphaera sp. Ch08]|uniref:Uncharacterized protein n=1 Tax=Singulisphaera sp. Ch08 TaxID=3120278 RepID=A0AAU7C904_9BACT
MLFFQLVSMPTDDPLNLLAITTAGDVADRVALAFYRWDRIIKLLRDLLVRETILHKLKDLDPAGGESFADTSAQVDGEGLPERSWSPFDRVIIGECDEPLVMALVAAT